MIFRVDKSKGGRSMKCGNGLIKWKGMLLKPALEDNETFNIPLENVDIDLEENGTEPLAQENSVEFASLDLELMTFLEASHVCMDDEILDRLLISILEAELLKAVTRQLETLVSSRLVKFSMSQIDNRSDDKT